MTTTVTLTDSTTARQRNEAVWRQSSAALHGGRIDEFLAYWHEDCRYSVAYPVGELPAVVAGREALGELFAGFAAAAASIEVADVRFHQTDDPQVAIVEEHMTAVLHDGWRYENDLVIRVTFRDGLLADMHEYYGQGAHTEMLRRLGLVA